MESWLRWSDKFRKLFIPTVTWGQLVRVSHPDNASACSWVGCRRPEIGDDATGVEPPILCLKAEALAHSATAPSEVNYMWKSSSPLTDVTLELREKKADQGAFCRLDTWSRCSWLQGTLAVHIRLHEACALWQWCSYVWSYCTYILCILKIWGYVQNMSTVVPNTWAYLSKCARFHYIMDWKAISRVNVPQVSSRTSGHFFGIQREYLPQ